MTTIRPAKASDAGALARLAERTFRESFAAQNLAADMDHHCATHFGEAMQLNEIADSNTLNLIAVHRDQLVAFAQVRLRSPNNLVTAERPAEIHRFYVLKQWHGQGLAHELMSALLKAPSFSDVNADALWLSVWQRNPRAIAFYHKHGFKVVGESLFHVGSDSQRDWLLSLKIHAQRAHSQVFNRLP